MSILHSVAFVTQVAVAAAPLESAAQIERFDAADRAAVHGLVGNARLVTFGEAAHRLDDAHVFAAQLFRYLVEEKGVRVLVLESSWRVNEQLMPFVNSDADTLDAGRYFYLNTFASRRVFDMLRLVRAHNRANPDDPIGLAGMQPENPVSDARSIAAFMGRIGATTPAAVRRGTALVDETFAPFATDLAFVIGLAQGDSRSDIVPELRRRLVATLDTLDRYLITHEPQLTAAATSPAWLTAHLSVVSLRGYLRHMLPFAQAFTAWARAAERGDNPPPSPVSAALRQSAYQGGDAVRAAIVGALLSHRYAGKRAMIWLHNWHAAGGSESLGFDHPAVPPPGTRSFGTVLETRYGPDHVIIGSVVPPPDTRACDEADPDLGCRFRAVLGSRRTIVNLHHPDPRHAALPLASVGRLVADPGLGITMTGVDLSAQFDGVVYFPEWR